MISFHDIAKGSDHMIRFLHVATETRVEFPAFVTEFSDSFQVGWGNETIFGRMDPVKPYQGTTRTISLGFDVVAPSLQQAKENMNNYSTLVQMMYPVYNKPLSGGFEGKGRTIKAPPILRIQFMNLIKNNSDSTLEEGLLGCISGFTFNPNKEAGFFDQNNELLPKHFNISFKFDPQHETTLGFDEENFINQGFPYDRPRNTPSSEGSTSGTPEVSAKLAQDMLRNLSKGMRGQ
tara:strand:+ start:132 stop:833 length:702 start_codon:yes stop_codon:yes gene_type:complete